MIPSPCNDDDLFALAPNPSVRIFRPHPRLLVAFDVRLRTPVYVLEKLVVLDDSMHKRRRHHFHEEARLEEFQRNRNHHFASTGFDKGHMAPAADFAPREDKATYNLTNVVAQNPTMNRTIWAHLERWTRQVARQNEENDVYVVTGPLWLPIVNEKHTSDDKRDANVISTPLEYRYPALGAPPNMVHVPTHLFKVIVVFKNHQIIQYACFVVPNEAEAAKLELQEVLVPWTALEAVAGLSFFPSFTRDARWKRHVDQQCLQLQDLRRNKPALPPPSSSCAEKSRDQGVEHLCRMYSCRRLPQKGR